MNSNSRGHYWIYKLDKLPETKHLKLLDQAPKELKYQCKRLTGDVAVFHLDIYGFISSWSPQAEALYGYDPDEMIGKHISSLYSTGDLLHGRPALELQTAANQSSYYSVGWQKRKNGQTFWAYSEYQAVKEADGEISGYKRLVLEAPCRAANEQ